MPCPNPAVGSPILAGSHLIPFPNTDTICHIMNLEIHQNLVKNILGPLKLTWAGALLDKEK